MEINRILGVRKTFGELQKGDVFIDRDGECCMKMLTFFDDCRNEANSVSLENGSMYYINEKNSVLLVQATVEIK